MRTDVLLFIAQLADQRVGGKTSSSVVTLGQEPKTGDSQISQRILEMVKENRLPQAIGAQSAGIDDTKGVEDINPGLPDSGRATPGFDPFNPPLSREARRATRVSSIDGSSRCDNQNGFHKGLQRSVGCWTRNSYVLPCDAPGICSLIANVQNEDFHAPSFVVRPINVAAREPCSGRGAGRDRVRTGFVSTHCPA